MVLVATIAHATPLTSTISAIGGATATVPHCQVQDYYIAANDTISTVNALVECDTTGTYKVSATVTSGASGSGETTGVSLTADIALSVAVSISPSVTIGSQTYDVDIQVTK